MSEQGIDSSVVLDAWVLMGGDHIAAARRAKNFRTVEGWTAWQMVQTGSVGALALAIPAAHIPAVVVDVAVLFHKMAYCSWGIGSILDCEIHPKDDLAVILGMWAGAISEDSLDAAGSALGIGAAGAAALAFPSFAGQVSGHGLGLSLASAAKAAEKPAMKAALLVGEQLAPIGGKIVEKISAKIAAKLSAKITAKTLSAALAGFVPFVGPVAGAGVNTWFMHKVTDAADLYYKKKRVYDQRVQELTKGPGQARPA